MQTVPNGNGGSKFVWIIDLYPDNAADSELVDASVESIKAALRS